MAFGLATHFLLFLWFSGVNQFVNPSSEAGSGLDPEVDLDNPLALPLQYSQYATGPLRTLNQPPSHADPLQDEPFLLRRQYRLEDFLWTGSGDGPHPSETDGGLAWEDNGGGYQIQGPGLLSSSYDNHYHHPSKSYIRVTKTMTLYRTVLTTIYPVEMTPIVTLSPSDILVSPTPISPSPTAPYSSGEDSNSASSDSNIMWIPTPTFSPTGPPLATANYPGPGPSTSTPEPDLSPQDTDLDINSLDQLFWIQTSIKANSSVLSPETTRFHQAMQKGLAKVYAKAFKRHLLATLGVLQTQQQQQQRRKKRRSRRSPFYHSDLDSTEPLPHLRWMYVAHQNPSQMSPNQLKQLATAAMNVTVKLLNASISSPETKLDLKYVVLAEGSPVPAFSAVRELDLISKKEMEDTLGYEIWSDKKAEALVAGPPPEQMTRNDKYAGQTSPWLIVAITTICLLVILLALIGFMVWKWKHNRLGDLQGQGSSAGGSRQGHGHHHRGHRHGQGGGARPQSGSLKHRKSKHVLESESESEQGMKMEGEEKENSTQIDEEGVINPAFLGTPKRTTTDETLDPSPKSSPAHQALLSARARARTATQRLSEVLTRLPTSTSSTKVIKTSPSPLPPSPPGDSSSKRLKYRKEVDWQSPNSSSEDFQRVKRPPAGAPFPLVTSSEGSADWKELLGEPRPHKTRRRSPTRTSSKPSTSHTQQHPTRRRKKAQIAEEANLKTDFEGEEDDDDDDDTEESTEERVPTPPGPSRGKDAISLGNLDIFQDSAVAQTPSEYARKLVPWKRPGSAVGATSSTSSSSKPYFLPSCSTMDRPQSRIQTIEEIPSFDPHEELDRALSEKSNSPPSHPRASSSTKEQGVQTPTRKSAKASTTAGYKQRASAKPRKTWRGSPGHHGDGGSVISTESEEIVEVHHIPGSGLPDGENNPLGKMRKRFHQFLDDAFNVMGGRTSQQTEDILGSTAGAGLDFGAGAGAKKGRGETQSAKVSISHEVVQTETEWRPWTSHVVREETLQKSRRPKSSVAVPVEQVIGPPKPAWTASSERRQTSAASGSSVHHREESREPSKSILKTTSSSQDPQSSSSLSSVVLSPAFIFPQYPTYPDIRVDTPRQQAEDQPGTSSSSVQEPPTLPPGDPAVPLIQAIKKEMKKFEKDKG